MACELGACGSHQAGVKSSYADHVHVDALEGSYTWHQKHKLRHKIQTRSRTQGAFRPQGTPASSVLQLWVDKAVMHNSGIDIVFASIVYERCADIAVHCTSGTERFIQGCLAATSELLYIIAHTPGLQLSCLYHFPLPQSEGVQEGQLCPHHPLDATAGPSCVDQFPRW